MSLFVTAPTAKGNDMSDHITGEKRIDILRLAVENGRLEQISILDIKEALSTIDEQEKQLKECDDTSVWSLDQIHEKTETIKNLAEATRNLVARCETGDFYGDYDADWALINECKKQLKGIK